MAATAEHIPTVRAEFPEKVQFLFRPARYKVAWGGRGGAKSWGFARALLLAGVQRPMRILCAREIQKSIADSVHQLLEEQIGALGLSDCYQVQGQTILGSNGTEIIFAGLKHNVESIKSVEALDVVWVEEAQTVSKSSWETLIPTVRKEGSEIWVSFNPDLETDDTYRRFVLRPPPGAVVVKIGYRDNPWFPGVLRREMEHLRATDPDAYAHVWEGNCISVLAGAIYAAELRLAEQQERITRVPYDRTRPVDCYWDLGFGDLCAVWFVQPFPLEYRVIDYLESSGQPIQWYLAQMQARGYVYGLDWLPWDLGLHAAQMGTGKSVEELMRLAGRQVRITPKLRVADGINAARTVFPQCWFDQERCADGINALRHYRYGVHQQLEGPAGQTSATRTPVHDWASHGADAFRYFAVASQPPKPKAPKSGRGWGGSWMG